MTFAQKSICHCNKRQQTTLRTAQFFLRYKYIAEPICYSLIPKSRAKNFTYHFSTMKRSVFNFLPMGVSIFVIRAVSCLRVRQFLESLT